jgi:hypothetical protein
MCLDMSQFAVLLPSDGEMEVLAVALCEKVEDLHITDLEELILLHILHL